MTFAWYGHLKYHSDKPLWATILISWGIAFFEYRLGYGRFTGYELKIIQEVVTIVVFVGFAWLVLGEKLRWSDAVRCCSSRAPWSSPSVSASPRAPLNGLPGLKRGAFLPYSALARVGRMTHLLPEFSPKPPKR